jgi:selenocysteine-specific elongation factor
LETLRARLGRRSWMADAVLDRLVREGELEIVEGIVATRGWKPRSAGGEVEVDRVVAALRAAALSPPSTGDLARALDLRDPTGALRVAAGQGLVQAVEHDRYYAAEALERFTEILREVGQGGSEIQPAALRERTGLSRKYLIPLLEWSDRTGVTCRDSGGTRRLAASRAG